MFLRCIYFNNTFHCNKAKYCLNKLMISRVYSSTSVPTLKMNNGKNIPAIGLGTWQAQGEVTIKTVKAAIDIGYRLIDTALVYGNEKEVGKAVNEQIKKGVVKREDLFITTKLWIIYHSVEDVVPACKQSLSNLKLDFVDLYLIHWPFGLKSKSPPTVNQKFESNDNTSIEDTWKSMEQCVKQGYTKSIGLSNFNSSQVHRICNVAIIKPVVNQVECHLYLNQRKLIRFCKEKNIIVEGYAPVGSPARPSFISGATEPLIKNKQLIKLGQQYKKTPAQIALRYLIQLGVVPLPKTVTPARLKENIEVFDFKLTDSEMSELHKCNKNLRLFPFLIPTDQWTKSLDADNIRLQISATSN